MASYQCVLRFFHSTCLKYCACMKKWCQVKRSAAPVTQNHLSKPKDLMLQNATLSGNHRPDLLTALMMMSLVLRLPQKMHLCRSSSNVPRLPSFLEMLQNPHVLLTFDKVHNPLRLPRESTSERPKVLRSPQLFALLTLNCASRHYGVHFFDISTSKSATNVRCFSILLAFSLANVLRATTACNFSSLIWPAGFAPAALASLLFDPPEPQIMGKHSVFATLLPFRAPGSSFFWDFLFFDLLSSSLLFSSLLWLLPPLLFICPYCRKFDF